MNPLRLSFSDARTEVLARTPTLPAVEVEWSQAAGRALRRDLLAPHALPPFANAAMDGFALRCADARGAGGRPVVLPVEQVLPAGVVSRRALAEGHAARIMTGALVPEGADCVVPFEEVERGQPGPGEIVILRREPSAGDHIRSAGADVAEGAVALHAGQTLTPHALALAGAFGQRRLWVGPRPRVAVFSTGDELLDLDAALEPGRIRDTNLTLLASLVEEAGGDTTLAERLPDDPERVGRRLSEALDVADVVLSIGGVSAGDHDPVKVALRRFGSEVALWRVDMRPGRPQGFGTPRGRHLHALPGNPASVACVFDTLIRPALRKMQGFLEIERPLLSVQVQGEVESRAGRTDFVRATLEARQGTWWARAAGAQVSGHLGPQARAHGLLEVPHDAERLGHGEVANFRVWRLPGA